MRLLTKLSALLSLSIIAVGIVFYTYTGCGCQGEPDPLEQHIAVYSYNTEYSDSVLVAELWYRGDLLVSTTGNFTYSLPFRSEFVTMPIIAAAKGREVYGTYDSLTCEVGGTSAWNRYRFTYNTKGHPLSILHEKGFREWYDNEGNFHVRNNPEYVFGERIEFEYTPGRVVQSSYDIII